MYRGIFWAVFSWEIVYLYLCFRTLVEDFSHFWELFLLGSQYCLERVQRRCYGNCFGKEIKFNLIYCTLTKTFPGIPGEILVKFAKFEFQMHRRFFRGNCVSSANKSQINYFSGFFWRKTFFGKNVTAKTSKLDFPCRDQRFSQSCLSWNFCNFLLVFGLWAKKFQIFVELSKWVVKTVLECTVQNLDEDFLGKN